MRRILILVSVAAITLTVMTPAVANNGQPLGVALTGAGEVPGPGDPDGTGSARIQLNSGQGRVCFDIDVTGVRSIEAAHIHDGVAGVAGPVVVDFDVATNGLDGCVDGIDRSVIRAITADPGGYYLNVHNEQYPAGALRGQLGRTTGDFEPRHSQRPASVPGQPLYLALGDSWAWGEGVAAGTEATAGYVALFHEALKTVLDCSPSAADDGPEGCEGLQLQNLARPGRNGDRNPGNDVELVTLHVGGNDVSGPIQAACLGGLDPDCIATWLAEMAAFDADLDAVVGALRVAAGPDTSIVLGTYDNPVLHCWLFGAFGFDAVLLGAAVLEGVTIPVAPGVFVHLDGIHEIIRDVASDYGAEVAELFGELSGADFVGGADCLHAVESGHEKARDAFLEALGA